MDRILLLIRPKKHNQTHTWLTRNFTLNFSYKLLTLVETLQKGSHRHKLKKNQRNVPRERCVAIQTLLTLRLCSLCAETDSEAEPVVIEVNNSAQVSHVSLTLHVKTPPATAKEEPSRSNATGPRRGGVTFSLRRETDWFLRISARSWDSWLPCRRTPRSVFQDWCLWTVRMQTRTRGTR